MPLSKRTNLVKSPKNEGFYSLVRDGKVVGSVTRLGQNEVHLRNAKGEALGAYDNTDLAIARIEELIELQEFRFDPLK